MESNSTNKLLEAALQYARNGWHIFPCKPNSKIPLIGKSEDGNGCLDATTDETQIRAWWTTCPNANIGLLCGEKSGLAVVDVDVGDKKNGWETLKRFPDLPETVTQMTPTGGAHKIYRIPKSTPAPKNRNGFPTKKDGIDIRSTNYYIMLTPSVHPDTRTEYSWADGQAPWEMGLEPFPDFMRPENRPKERRKMPWEQVANTAAKIDPPTRAAIQKVRGTPIIDRARLYLRECEPAVQGNAGHDSLLWAARALVIGFELDDSTAISLLWEEFNPRCMPPWDQLEPSEVKDFERKVRQVQETPGEKPKGWLLDEYGLKTNNEAMQALGAQFAASLLGDMPTETTPQEEPIAVEPHPYLPFPTEVLPEKVRDYAQLVAGSHCVDESFTGLPILVAAGAAMGNAFRLRLKNGFDVCPTLWGAVVSPSGTNKSGPLKDILRGLQSTIPIDKVENPMLNPQGRTVLSDATLEAVVAKLGANPRGLLIFRGELAGWLKSFNAYKKGGGGDEQAWLEFWDAHSYQLDRKTNSEEIFIPAAAVAVLGGIQPKVLAECFDPGKFASGLVPRLLIAAPPTKPMYWSETEISEKDQDEWVAAIEKLRTRPFQSMEPLTMRYAPHILMPEDIAKQRYVDFFNSISFEIESMSELERIFASKSRVIAARLALIHHGLRYACGEIDDIHSRVELCSMEAGIELAKWFLNEQFRVYGAAKAEHDDAVINALVERIKAKGGSMSPRVLQKSNQRKYPAAIDARKELDTVVSAGKGRWEGVGARAKVVLV